MAELVYLVTALSADLLHMIKHSRNPCLATTTEDLQKFIMLGAVLTVE
jgi:hypothetical protein